MRPGKDIQTPLVMAIDIGSSSVRVSVFDTCARSIPGTEARQHHHIHTAPDGAAELNPLELTRSVEEMIDASLAKTGALAQNIAAVSIGTLAYNVMGIDRRGYSLTSIYTYADSRSYPDVVALHQELDAPAVYQRTGCPIHSAYLPARFRWLQRTFPELFQQAYRWVDAATYLYGRWFGQMDTLASYSMASWSGLLARHRQEWDTELLASLGLSSDALPPLDNYDTPRQGLTPEFAQRWPALKDVPFFLAVGDGAAANIGSGCVTPERVALTIGTSGAMRVLLKGQQVEHIPPGLWAYSVCKEDSLVGGAFSNGGNILIWLRNTLQIPGKEEAEAALQAMPPAGHGLSVLPFLAGERSPGWATTAAGAMYGLRQATTPLEIAQAFLEAASYRFVPVWQQLRRCSSPGCQIIASGGAITRSPYWMQLMADVLDYPVTLCDADEATSRGLAILALFALGRWTTLHDCPVDLGKSYQPNAQNVLAHQTSMDQQYQLYSTLIGDSLGKSAHYRGSEEVKEWQ